MSQLKSISLHAAAAAKSLQSCPSLCDPIDGSPPGSPVPGILQTRTLEWVTISFSNAWKWKVKVKPLSHVRLLATTWTAAYQSPPSMGFSRQEYCLGQRKKPLRRQVAPKDESESSVIQLPNLRRDLPFYFLKEADEFHYRCIPFYHISIPIHNY